MYVWTEEFLGVLTTCKSFFFFILGAFCSTAVLYSSIALNKTSFVFALNRRVDPGTTRMHNSPGEPLAYSLHGHQTLPVVRAIEAPQAAY